MSTTSARARASCWAVETPRIPPPTTAILFGEALIMELVILSRLGVRRSWSAAPGDRRGGVDLVNALDDAQRLGGVDRRRCAVEQGLRQRGVEGAVAAGLGRDDAGLPAPADSAPTFLR